MNEQHEKSRKAKKAIGAATEAKPAEQKDQAMTVVPDEAEKAASVRRENELATAALKMTGTSGVYAAGRILQALANTMVIPRVKQEEALENTVAVMAEIAPANAIEAMLATHLLGVNDAAMIFLAEALKVNKHPETIDANLLRATRLMRLFNEQLEAMQKLKGKAGQQKVTVEHVHVHEGGQAIVGTVNRLPGGRGGGEQQ